MSPYTSNKQNYILSKLAIIFVVFIQTVTVAQISVIVSRSSENVVDEVKLKNIYAGNILKWETGDNIVLIDQSDTRVGSDFYKSFMKVPVNIVVMKWTKLVLSGAADAPQKANSNLMVRNLVASNKNAIGYISTNELDSSVREIFRVE